MQPHPRDAPARAYFLQQSHPDNARALMTVTGGRTVYELRGISCLPLELMEPTRKGIAVTRSFGAPVTSWEPMREAIASYATRAAEKMRRYRVAAENIFVFMHTNTFNNDPFYSNGASAAWLSYEEKHLLIKVEWVPSQVTIRGTLESSCIIAR